MIIVLATIEIADGQRDDFFTQFHEIVPLVRAEDGCIEYGPTIDVETNIAAQGPLRDNVATIVEKWEDLAALEAHLVAPHMLEYRQRVKDLVKQVQIQVLQPV